MDNYENKLLQNQVWNQNKGCQTSFVLEMQLWRLTLNNEEIKIAICLALNHAVVSRKIEIAGYFITDWRIYLILNANQAEAALFLLDINAYIINKIIRLRPENNLDLLLENTTRENDYTVFKKLPFYEYHLERILLNEPDDITYSNQSVRELKEFLRNYNFCSVQDYHNCKGPVFVNSIGEPVRTLGINLSILNKKYFDSDIEFAITCVTNGRMQGRNLLRNWRLIRRKDWVAGGYHVFKPNENLIEQAELYVYLMSRVERPLLPPIVKIDHKYWHSPEIELRFEERILEFLILLEEFMGRKPIIYTKRNTANLHLKSPVFGNYPLWIIDNYSEEEPRLPQAWKLTEWLFWQHRVNTDDGRAENDHQFFNGSTSQLKTFIKNN